jgi:hypothetical protein
MEKRWRAGRVDYNLSFGAFDKGSLVGFIITGVDNLNDIKTAYNAGTSVIPEYRNQRLVQQLYAVALPEFKAEGIKQTILEVITQNEKAIKAYQKVGFQIVRTLHCIKGDLQVNFNQPADNNIRVSCTSKIDFDQLLPLQPYEFSWDNRNEGVTKIIQDFKCWLLHQNNNLKGYVLLDPATGYLAQLGFDPENTASFGKTLFQAIKEYTAVVRIINVDSQAKSINELLVSLGLENNLDQYEMLLHLN